MIIHMFLILWENSRHEELRQPSLSCWYCTIQLSTKSSYVAFPYYDASLINSLKSFIYSLPGMPDFKIRFKFLHRTVGSKSLLIFFFQRKNIPGRGGHLRVVAQRLYMSKFYFTIPKYQILQRYLISGCNFNLKALILP